MAMLATRRNSELQSGGLNVFAEMQSLNDQLRRLAEDWNRFPSLLGEAGEGFAPLADVEETDDAYLVEIELAGVNRDDIDVSLDGRQLVVTGERKEKERVGILRRRTRVTGRFRYEVTLPNCDPEAEVTANYSDGVLTVRVPKPVRERPRRIPVS
jgi:HSP20 family protein